MKRVRLARKSVVAAALAVAAVALVGAVALAAFPGAKGDDRQTVPAPIDGLDVAVLESFPPQYMLKVRAGLPSGCAQRDSHSVSRSGEVITVTVLNSMPKGNPVCTMIYGTYELNINLGSEFRPGTTYTVRVNDRSTTFTAR